MILVFAKATPRPIKRDTVTLIVISVIKHNLRAFFVVVAFKKTPLK